MNNFEVNIELSETMQPYTEKILLSIFPSIDKIIRTTFDENDEVKQILDKELGVDAIIRFKNQSIITLQEKVRDFCFRNYDDFTIQYYTNRFSKTKYQWFKLASQLFFYGYVNEKEDGFLKWYIINIPAIRIFLSETKIKEENGISYFKLQDNHKWKKVQDNSKNNSNFIYVPFSKIPESCIPFSSFKNPIDISVMKKERKLPEMASYKEIISKMEV